ncbi:MAG: ankyrin repeat domain-containing protein [Rickettsiales bacterium]
MTVVQEFMAAFRKGDQEEAERKLEELKSSWSKKIYQDFLNVVAFDVTKACESSAAGPMMKFILDKGAQINSMDTDGNNLITHLIENDYFGLAELVALRANQREVNFRNTENTTPLAMAAAKGNIQCVKVLISRGANKDFETKNDTDDKMTALDFAMDNDNVDVVRYLHSIGAKFNHPELAEKEEIKEVMGFGGDSESELEWEPPKDLAPKPPEPGVGMDGAAGGGGGGKEGEEGEELDSPIVLSSGSDTDLEIVVSSDEDEIARLGVKRPRKEQISASSSSSAGRSFFAEREDAKKARKDDKKDIGRG